MEYVVLTAIFVAVTLRVAHYVKSRRAIRLINRQMRVHDAMRDAELEVAEARSRLHVAADMLQGARGTPLEAACRQNHFEVLTTLEVANARLQEARTACGRIGLHYPTGYGGPVEFGRYAGE